MFLVFKSLDSVFCYTKWISIYRCPIGTSTGPNEFNHHFSQMYSSSWSSLADDTTFQKVKNLGVIFDFCGKLKKVTPQNMSMNYSLEFANGTFMADFAGVIKYAKIGRLLWISRWLLHTIFSIVLRERLEDLTPISEKVIGRQAEIGVIWLQGTEWLHSHQKLAEVRNGFPTPPEPLEEGGTCQHRDFNPVILILNFWPSELWGSVVWAIKFLVICYSGQGH